MKTINNLRIIYILEFPLPSLVLQYPSMHFRVEHSTNIDRHKMSQESGIARPEQTPVLYWKIAGDVSEVFYGQCSLQSCSLW